MRDKKKTKLKWTKNKSNRESGERYIYSKERAVDAERGEEGDQKKGPAPYRQRYKLCQMKQEQETNKQLVLQSKWLCR